MTKISVKNLKGEKVKDLTLADSVWNVEVNNDCLKKAVKLQLDSMRQGTRKTKTRAEVSGGGRKPWKQKGTGRARSGSIRSIIWRGGGIAFGVKPKDFGFKINRKERRIALKSALTLKVLEKKLVVLDNIELTSEKTKEFKNVLSTLNLDKKVLFVTSEDLEKLYLASRNLLNIGYILADGINCRDILNADVLVCDVEAVKQIEEALK